MKRPTPKVLFWYNHVEKFLNSGQQQHVYCKKHNLNAKSFSVRKSEYLKRKRQTVDQSSGFIPLKPKKSSVCIKLPTGLEITFDQIPDPVWMGQVLNCLGDEHAQH